MKGSFHTKESAQSYIGNKGWSFAGSITLDDVEVAILYRHTSGALGVLFIGGKGKWRFAK